MTALLILNPGANRNTSRKRWTRYQAEMDRAGLAYKTVETTSIEDCKRLAAQCRDCDCVIACGGEGTINAVTNGLLQNPDSSIRLGVFYTGARSDFCRYHGIPRNPKEAVALLSTNNVTDYYPAHIVYHTEDGRMKEAYYNCSCGFTLSAEICEIIHDYHARFGYKIGSALALWRVWRHRKPYDLLLEANNHAPVVLKEIDQLLVMCLPYLACGLKVDFNFDERDNRLAIWGVQRCTFFIFLCLLKRLLFGQKTRHHPQVVCMKSKSIFKFSALIPVKIAFDGDFRGYLPIEVSRGDKPIHLICNRPVLNARTTHGPDEF